MLYDLQIDRADLNEFGEGIISFKTTGVCCSCKRRTPSFELTLLTPDGWECNECRKDNNNLP